MYAADSVKVSARFSSKAPRSARRSISFESLECRTLLSGSIQPLSVGIEGGGNASTDTAYMFANEMLNSQNNLFVGKWGSQGLTQGAISNVPLPTLDQNGWPIGLGDLPSNGEAVYSQIYTGAGKYGMHYPTGTYTLTFDGNGTVAVQNSCKCGAQSFTQNGGLGSPHNVDITESARAAFLSRSRAQTPPIM